MFSQPYTTTIAVPGASLFCESYGDPQNPTLVFVHAGVADRTMWDPQIDVFATDYFVIRYDTRGFGKTETTDTVFSNRQDLIAVLDYFEIPEAVLVGCSRAGTIVLDTTIEFPGRVRGLVWVCGGLSGGSYTPDPTDPRDAVAEALFAEAEALEAQRDWQRLAALEVQIWADGLAQPAGRCRADVREKMREMCLSNYKADWSRGTSLPLAPPAADRLADVKAPTLIVLGDLDERSTELAAKTLAASIAGAQLEIMPGTAHVPSMEKPEVFNRLLLAFLQKVLR